jgi:hypothetical protein
MSDELSRVDRRLATQRRVTNRHLAMIEKELDKLRFWYLCIGTATILNGLAILTVAFPGAS